MQYLLENYGYFGEMLIMTGIVCNYFVAATFYKPLQQLVCYQIFYRNGENNGHKDS